MATALSERKFLHTCPDCQGQYRVTIRVDIETVHRARCPHCNQLNYFDNEGGKLRVSPTVSRRPVVERSVERPVPPPDPVLPRSPLRPAPRPPLAGRSDIFSPSPATPWRASLERMLRLVEWRVPLLIALLAGGFLTVLFVFSLTFPGLWLRGDSAQYLQKLAVVQPNRIVDRRGDVLAELFNSRTSTLRAEEIPESMRNMLIFIEDQHFFNHSGVHYSSLFRAAFRNVFALGYSQGGSTISQQLGRILLGDREKSLWRKVREANLAFQLEKQLGKDAILTAYMNHVYLGHGSRGFGVAARFYFNKELKDLSFAEELALASLPSAPERFSPLKNPALLEAKMDIIFRRMQNEQFTRYPQEQYIKEKREMFRTLNRSPTASVFGTRINHAPYVTEYIRLKVRELMGQDFEYSAGLTIKTTIQADLQKKAESESIAHIQAASARFPAVIMRDGRAVNEKEDLETTFVRAYAPLGLGAQLLGLPVPPALPTRLQTASVAVDPSTGAVLFMQGGNRFSPSNQLNRVTQMVRQTGSAIKPFIYAAAIESGAVSPSMLIDDSPLYIPQRPEHSQGKGYWMPTNISGDYLGPITVRQAFAQSRNVPAIRVLQRATLPVVATKFRSFFWPDESVFAARFREDLTIAIGSLEMSPLEMAVAMSAFAADGMIQSPYLIESITDADGRVVYRHLEQDEFGLKVPARRRALSSEAAGVMAALLSDSAAYGGTAQGGFKPRGGFLGKTGTSNDSRDTWFVGAVPGLSMAVWVGYDNPRYSVSRGTGSTVAGPLWGRIARHFASTGSFPFSIKTTRVNICRDSGLLPGPYCPVVNDVIPLQSRPVSRCTLDHEHTPAEESWSINSGDDFR